MAWRRTLRAAGLIFACLLFSPSLTLAQFTQQAKLVGTGAVGQAAQGQSVAISGDGNTALVGGPYDNAGIGAAWVYTRISGVWIQQGGKLVATDAIGPQSLQGQSVALSADGNTAIVVQATMEALERLGFTSGAMAPGANWAAS